MRINEITNLDESNEKSEAWINKIYTMLPANPLDPNQRVIMLSDEQFALFELEPSQTKQGAVEVKWFQAYPLRQGVGSKAMRYLQNLAKKDGITLTLYPWAHGKVSQNKLTKFYKQQGFKPSMKGQKTMIWSPEKT